MKIVICTTPIRPVPTEYPPFGSMAIIQSLRSVGYDPFFYDIDVFRPSFEEVVNYFQVEAPDVVGISAVVSTAYGYTKKLALAIKEVLPETKIVVGGNLAASAEILLRFCKIDFCVIGEGERVVINLCRYLERNKQRSDYSELRGIKGLTYLDKDGQMIFTGYEAQIPAAELFEPDFSILEEYSRIDQFVHDRVHRADFAQDARTFQEHRRGKKVATVLSTKGCVARCTFCHRWDRGYRAFSVESVIRRIKYLIEKYDVGFILFGDENFASDRRQVEELIKQIKPLDILYTIQGVRVRSVDLDLLKRLRDSGCVSAYYGIETGSPRMLTLMEKNLSLEQNINACLWTYEAGLYTVYQFVLAMPGETHETIEETLEFVKHVTEFLDEPPHKRLSINYIQALPGTPVYEYARAKGLIGRSLEEEERYLFDISDINAADDTKFLNFTEYDYLTVQSWRPKILFEAEAHYYRKRNWKKVGRNLSEATLVNGSGASGDLDQDYTRGGYFNLQRLVFHPLFYRIFYRFRPFYLAAYILRKDFRKFPLKQFLAFVYEWAYNKVTRRKGLEEDRSLRKVMIDIASPPVTESEKSMKPLREGR